MNIYSIKPKFQKLLAPVFNLFVFFKIHPDFINILALIVSIIAGICLLFADVFNILFIIVPILLLLRTSLNALDGMVARKLGLSSKSGELYNEFCDRLSDVAIFICLAFAKYTDPALILILTCLILLNSYLGILGKAAGGSRQYIGLIGKADRMLYLGIMCIISFFILKEWYWQLFTIYLLLGTFISIIQRFFSIRKELKNL